MSQTKTEDPIHTLTLTAMARMLGNTAAMMDKAEQHAKAHTIPLENLLQARLYPDMMNLLQQLQYTCYLAVDFARHFSGKEPPRVGYDEETWEQLRKSLTLAATYLAEIPAQRIATEAGKIVPTFMDGNRGMPAVDYAASVIVPDFHFHVVVAYALLRHNGVPLGKSDYLGNLETIAIAGGSA